MAKPRRIEIGERVIEGWTLKSYIWEDAESGDLISYNHHYQRIVSSGFAEFVRFDLHKKGESSEDAPHVHLRLQSRPTSRLDECVEIFSEVIKEIPSIERVVK
ncbi:MAG: hypothetical protein M1503_11885 [Thaumarchaeota archaeon]|nr:hypothetical protein [Nitrososphaerota archaeon]